jgi:hypothetical protein
MSKQGARIKAVWKGMFNYNRELYILYCNAYSKRQAWVCFCHRLADKHGVRPQVVMNYFNGQRDNYEITIETEYKEIEENG